MLRQVGYDNVISFTYGRTESREIRSAQQVANAMDVKWRFVEYTKRTWQDQFASDEYGSFCSFAANLSVMPHPSDFVALKCLTNESAFSKDAVMLPGHTSLAPSQVSQRWAAPLSWQNLHNRIWELCYCHGRTKSRCNSMRLCKECVEVPSDQSQDLQRWFESWYWKNPETKYIFNTPRSAEFFGLDWYLPLAERELSQVYARMPEEFTAKKRTFNLYMDRVSQELGLPVNSQAEKQNSKKDTFQNWLGRRISLHK
jgi:asparagine synthase (glutamine-hydrolysing)